VIIDGNDPQAGEPVHVNVRVPIALLRFGVHFANFIPPSARQRVNEELRGRGMDVDLSQITAKDLDELVENLKDLSIDVEHKAGQRQGQVLRRVGRPPNSPIQAWSIDPAWPGTPALGARPRVIGRWE